MKFPGHAPWLREGCLCLLVALLTLAAYVQTVRFDFLTYDDPMHVTANPLVLQGLSGEGLWWAWSSRSDSMQAPDGAGDLWHPLTWLSFMLDAQLWHDWAGGYHLTNALLHCASAAMCCLLALRLGFPAWAASWIALVFALHPLQVDAVAWISARKGLLSSALMLAAMCCWTCGGAAGDTHRRRWTWGLGGLACLAKPDAVTLPLLLLWLDLGPLRRAGEGMRKLFVEKWPLLLMTAFTAAVAMVRHGRWAMVRNLEQGDLITRAGLAIARLGSYALRLFWPANLSPAYSIPDDLMAWQLTGLAVLAMAVWLGIRSWRARHLGWGAFAWAWTLTLLMPVLGLVYVGASFVYDRYTYLPLAGAALGLAGAVRDGTLPLPQKAAWAIGTTVLLVCSTLTLPWLSCWQDSGTLFASVHARGQKHPMVRANLARWKAEHGQPIEAAGLARDLLHEARATRDQRPEKASGSQKLLPAPATPPGGK